MIDAPPATAFSRNFADELRAAVGSIEASGRKVYVLGIWSDDESIREMELGAVASGGIARAASDGVKRRDAKVFIAALKAEVERLEKQLADESGQ